MSAVLCVCLAVSAVHATDVPRIMGVRVEDLPLGSAGRATCARLDNGDEAGALKALSPVLDMPGHEAARLLAIEIAPKLPGSLQRALLQRWRKGAGWTVRNGDPTWKRDDLALTYYLLAQKTFRDGPDRPMNPDSEYGTGVGFMHVESVRAKLIAANKKASLWRALATIAFLGVFGESPIGPARAQVEEVIRTYPRDPFPYLVATYLHRAGFVSGQERNHFPPDLEKALAFATRAMALGPDLATPPYVLGQMWIAKDSKKADGYFRRFVAIQRKAGRSVERERAALAKRGYRLPDFEEDVDAGLAGDEPL